MGHGSNNYFAVKLRGLRGIVRSWGLDRRFSRFGKAQKTKQPRFSAGLLWLKSVDVQVLGLERLHVFSLEAFGAIHQVELHGLAFLQAAESV